MDIIALFDACRFGFGAYCPSGGGFESSGPEDHAEVGPDRRVLVGEHHHLHAVLGHVLCQVLVDFHHRASEVVAIASHREFGAAIGNPFGKGLGKLFVIPREEKVGEFVVVDRVGVGRIGDPKVAGILNVTSIR